MQIVMFVDGELLVAPSDEPRCVARTETGERCTLSAMRFGNLRDNKRQLSSKRGVIDVHDLRCLEISKASRRVAQLWLDQRCEDHTDASVEKAVPPEWEPFDPDGRHAELVRPLTDSWA